MTATVVVLGAGYAGVSAIDRLESVAPDDCEIVWVSESSEHLVLHEVHRCIRDPTVAESITVPVETIAGPKTRFREARVTAIESGDSRVCCADGSTIEYDTAIVALGSQTATYDIPGVLEHGHTLKSLDDALGIHDAIREATSATETASVVIGGAGLTGVQAAGEVAALADRLTASIDVTILEGLDRVYPAGDRDLGRRLREELEGAGVTVRTGSFVDRVAADRITLDDDDQIDADVFVWTGGIRGQDAMRDSDLTVDSNSYRIHTARDFRTSDASVFAVGDAAAIDGPDGEPIPPTAEAAWGAGEAVADNVVRAMEGRPLEEWAYADKGTVASIGDDAVAHDVVGVPVETFGGPAARTLKKAIAARWLSSIDSPVSAARAWRSM
ncbi:MAG: NAD(P)/FAD-dependent oxidoreductase [Halococcoides sp.]